MSIFLVTVLLLPLSVYAADMPNNNIDVTFAFTEIRFNNTSFYPGAEFDTGTFNVLKFHSSVTVSSQFKTTVLFTLEASSSCDVYICTSMLYSDDVGAVVVSPSVITFKSLSDGSSLNRVSTLSSVNYVGDYFFTPVSLTQDSSSTDLSFGDLDLFENGSFILEFAKYTIPEGIYQFYYSFVSNPNFSEFSVPVAIYIDDPSYVPPVDPDPDPDPDPGTPTGDPIYDYQNGSISFGEAASQIRDNMNDVLNDEEATDFEKQMAIGVADNKLDQLQDVSDEKFAVIVDQFDSRSGEIVDYLASSGSTTVAPYIQDLNSSYADALTQATSPEQGILINTQYSVKLAQIQAIFQANYKRELDDVVSDEEMDEKESVNLRVEELLEAESEALAIFEESDYESWLYFSNWISEFGDVPTVYRSFFEFFFEDSKTQRMQPFLIIPFSLVIVGLILSTTTVVFRRR